MSLTILYALLVLTVTLLVTTITTLYDLTTMYIVIHTHLTLPPPPPLCHTALMTGELVYNTNYITSL